jgi:hypothetical protein
VTKRPIFIGGMFKSGTSLLRAMVGQHPNIASGLETYWFDIPVPNIESDKTQERLRQLAEFYEFEHEQVLSMAAAAGDNVAFLSALLDSYATRLGKRRWAEKTPGNIQHLDEIVAGWPDAKIVHVIRDPKDIFASLCQARKWDTVAEFGERWCKSFGARERFLRTLDLNRDRYLELRYESLVQDPAETTQQLFKFLEEEWDEHVAVFSGTEDDFNRVLAVTGKASTTLERMKQPLTTGRVGIWRRILSESDVAALRNAAAEQGLLHVFREIEETTPAYREVRFSR